MATNDIRVLVVDDSAVVREMLCDLISDTRGMKVAGKAEDGQKALDIFRSVNPDVVTLDIKMPRTDGLTTLDSLLARSPVPVIMVSALTQAGASITLDALERGALDCIEKPEKSSDFRKTFGDELIRKIRSAAGINVRRILEIRKARKQRLALKRKSRVKSKLTSTDSLQEYADKCIAIGISTGGPSALSSLFEMLHPPMPPVVVVQHMPTNFTKLLASRLDSLSKLSIKEAENGDILSPNHVLIAKAGYHLGLRRCGNVINTYYATGEHASGHKPSIDVMMRKVASIYGANSLGVIMTGMGRDGSDGCKEIRKAGGYVLGQDEASSDVYGMNKVAYAEGNVNRQFSLDEAASVITRQVRRLGKSFSSATVN